MSNYIYSPGWTWREYLQAQSFENSINGQIAKSSREIIATNEQLHHEQIEVARETTSAITSGFEQVSWKLDGMRQGIDEMNATLNWGFSSMLVSLGEIAVSLEELKRIARTPAQTWAQEQFDEARRAFERGWHEEALKFVERALNGYGSNTGYDLDFRFHYLLGLIRLGNVKNQSAEIIDLVAAEKAFLTSAKYSEPDDKREAARGMLCAGWAAYCQGEYSRSIEYTNKALRLNSQLGEAHFQLAKTLMHTNRPDDALSSLEKAVRLDRKYMPKADLDEDFQRHQMKVDHLFDVLRSEARDLADKHIAATQQKIAKLETIEVGGYTLVEYAYDPMSEADAKLKTADSEARANTYFGYLNAVDFCEQASPRFTEAISQFKEEVTKDLGVQISMKKSKIKEFGDRWKVTAWITSLSLILFFIVTQPMPPSPNTVFGALIAGGVLGPILGGIIALFLHVLASMNTKAVLAQFDSIKETLVSLEPF